jgi:glycosyltransferase involved in cell wall biosynthesis
MRIMFIYGPYSLGNRPIDFDSLEQSSRGLTGSELSCIRYAHEMAARGHVVTLAVAQPGLAFRPWRGIMLVDLRDADVGRQDVIYSWNEPDMLRGVPTSTLRMCNQQLNDFSYAHPGWQDHVDIVTSPSAEHARYLRTLPEAFAGRWEVVPNGCEPSDYEMRAATDGDVVQRPSEIAGRVIWASSADRGLHLLLQCWPEIKRRVPHASLRCYYHWGYDDLIHHERPEGDAGVDICEIARRARYMRHAIGVLKPLDVEHIGSVSREGIRQAFQEAEVLGFPCDTIRFTEGFSVTTLEGCASGALPLISDIDALGSIYGEADLPMVKSPVSSRLPEYIDLVERALTDRAWADGHRVKARAFAERHAWSVLAERLEGVITSAKVGLR